MATQDDVSRLALALPHVVATGDVLGFDVQHRASRRGIAWSWKMRIDPRRARVPNTDVLGVRLADQSVKEELLAADPDVYFTEPHYDGYPAVLVRLEAVGVGELGELLTDSWLCVAPRSLVREFERAREH
jgi:hypothetical protein